MRTICFTIRPLPFLLRASDPLDVVVDFSQSQIWDASTVAVLDGIENKYRAVGGRVRFVGLDERSKAFHARLSGGLHV